MRITGAEWQQAAGRRKPELLKWFWHRLQNFPWHFILEVSGWWQQKMSRLSYSAGISSHTDWATVTPTATTLSAEGKTALLEDGADYWETAHNLEESLQSRSHLINPPCNQPSLPLLFNFHLLSTLLGEHLAESWVKRCLGGGKAFYWSWSLT